jgi:hypothetical protein
LGIRNTEIADYIALLLANFARTENLYRIRDFRGRRLETGVEMLLEANLSWYSEQWDREKEIRKHIGDYILFMVGIFREWVEKRGEKRTKASVNTIEPFIGQGHVSIRNFLRISSFTSEH